VREQASYFSSNELHCNLTTKQEKLSAAIPYSLLNIYA